MTVGRGPCFDTYKENKEALCSTTVPVDQDMVVDLW